MSQNWIKKEHDEHEPCSPMSVYLECRNKPHCTQGRLLPGRIYGTIHSVSDFESIIISGYPLLLNVHKIRKILFY